MSTLQFKDDYLHLGQRRRLLHILRHKGIENEAVLEAMSVVPRHWFVPKAYQQYAYEDRALPIRNGQTISQPFTVAFQTALLAAKPRQKVLEIGTGSGYQAAVLGKLGLRVFTLERQERLYAQAKVLLDNHRFGQVRCFFRDGFRGLPVYGPFDRILVTAGAAELPQNLLKQLAIGGKLVIPVGEATQEMLVVTRVSEKEYQEERHGQFKFVPFLDGVVGYNEKAL